ncbi:MAG: bifunctional phosphopantothenoylcysteine decarboxylase/phosphopantothenate--cysteine ligase CoaBC, partial [Candidatus Hodarchaeales archaeon]
MSRAEIYGTKGDLLKGKRILVGVTGSIAAIEVPHLVREVLRYSGEPIVLLSQEALRFVTEDALTWSMGTKPYTEISGFSEHIQFTVNPELRVDLCLLCPATANTISKLANGIADGPVTLTALASIGAGIPCLIVPAAHSVLLDNPITKRSITYLESLNVQFLSAEEIENKHKFPSLDHLMKSIFGLIHPKQPLKGNKFLITGGATREYFDDVRFLSNPSSGLSALHVMKALEEMGASTTLIMGEGNKLDLKQNETSINIVRSTDDMYQSVKSKLKSDSYDGLISIAAVADYKPNFQSGKIPSLKDQISVTLTPTIKILKTMQQEFPDLFFVAYKAEVGVTEEELINRGKRFLEENQV